MLRRFKKWQDEDPFGFGAFLGLVGFIVWSFSNILFDALFG